MRYSICFTSGELAGKTFPLSQDKLLSIGRSNTSDVKLSSTEISPKHLTVRLSKANIAVIEVFSTHVTMHNGKSLSMGDSIEMAANDTVQLGSNDIFTLVSMAGSEPASDDDEMKTTIRPMTPIPPPSNDDDGMKTTIKPMAPVPPPPQAGDASKTKNNITMPPKAPKAQANASDGQSTKDNIRPPVKPAPAKQAPPRPAPAKQAPAAPAPAKAQAAEAPKGSGGETVAIQTLLASDEELDKIKSSYQSKQRRKTGLWVVIVAFFLALCISIYIITRPDREDQLTWPVASNGAFLNEYQVIFKPYLAVCFPKLPLNKMGEIPNGMEYFSAIGKLRDVPLHIVALTIEDKETLTKSREEAFQAWMKEQKEADSSLVFATVQEFVFTCTDKGSGVPFNRVSYTRRVENEDYFGYAVFLRYEDRVHTIMIEVPLAAQWRSSAFFKNYLDIMVIFASNRAPEFWEGTSDYKSKTTIEDDFAEVKIYQKRKSPVYWEKIHYCLISALIKAKQNGDEASLENAKSLLVKLRSEQREWYNTQKLAYQYALKNENKDTMLSIQSTASSIFTPEFQQSDYRYELIKRKDWK